MPSLRTQEWILTNPTKLLSIISEHRKKTGITLWAREDARRTPVNASLCRNIKMSSSVYRKQTRGLKTNTLLKSKTQEKAELQQREIAKISSSKNIKT